ncbi:MAG: hypothetical protein Q4E47_01210 [Candidatus Saccharibacteria bacterium]|nr:hypothetical protein [Candidatus Saccharibacteria bacterium]
MNEYEIQMGEVLAHPYSIRKKCKLATWLVQNRSRISIILVKEINDVGDKENL